MSTEAIETIDASEKVEMERLPEWDDIGESLIAVKELAEQES